MGRMQATEMASLAGFRQGIVWHLQSNHFPPVHQAFVDPAIEAIDAVNEEDGDRQITLPNGLVRSAWQIVEGLHLESWCLVHGEWFEEDDES